MTNDPTPDGRQGNFDRRDFIRLGAALSLGAILSPSAAMAAQAAPAGPDILQIQS
jgi:uncharacterized protein (DUF1501 family)